MAFSLSSLVTRANLLVASFWDRALGSAWAYSSMGALSHPVTSRDHLEQSPDLRAESLVFRGAAQPHLSATTGNGVNVRRCLHWRWQLTDTLSFPCLCSSCRACASAAGLALFPIRLTTSPWDYDPRRRVNRLMVIRRAQHQPVESAGVALELRLLHSPGMIAAPVSSVIPAWARKY